MNSAINHHKKPVHYAILNQNNVMQQLQLAVNSTNAKIISNINFPGISHITCKMFAFLNSKNQIFFIVLRTQLLSKQSLTPLKSK